MDRGGFLGLLLGYPAQWIRLQANERPCLENKQAMHGSQGMTELSSDLHMRTFPYVHLHMCEHTHTKKVPSILISSWSTVNKEEDTVSLSSNPHRHGLNRISRKLKKTEGERKDSSKSLLDVRFLGELGDPESARATATPHCLCLWKVGQYHQITEQGRYLDNTKATKVLDELVLLWRRRSPLQERRVWL